LINIAKYILYNGTHCFISTDHTYAVFKIDDEHLKLDEENSQRKEGDEEDKLNPYKYIAYTYDFN